jgi:membrane protein CcdC involved in cytochrome C biogenesis
MSDNALSIGDILMIIGILFSASLLWTSRYPMKVSREETSRKAFLVACVQVSLIVYTSALLVGLGMLINSDASPESFDLLLAVGVCPGLFTLVSLGVFSVSVWEAKVRRLAKSQKKDQPLE